MNQRLRQPPADPYRKVRFREEARDSAAKDGHDRKYGRVVEAGAIAQALERAYKQGFAGAQDGRAAAPLLEIPGAGPLK